MNSTKRNELMKIEQEAIRIKNQALNDCLTTTSKEIVFSYKVSDQIANSAESLTTLDKLLKSKYIHIKSFSTGQVYVLVNGRYEPTKVKLGDKKYWILAGRESSKNSVVLLRSSEITNEYILVHGYKRENTRCYGDIAHAMYSLDLAITRYTAVKYNR